MTPETIAALINLGAAGAVIFVVALFLKDRERSDLNWRKYFSDLNQANCNTNAAILDTQKRILELLSQISQQMETHDSKVNARIRAASRMDEERSKTRPRPEVSGLQD